MKDKRITPKQCMEQIHRAYDHFEKVAKQTLREEFGFGPTRMARFEERFSELSAAECERIREDLRRQRI